MYIMCSLFPYGSLPGTCAFRLRHVPMLAASSFLVAIGEARHVHLHLQPALEHKNCLADVRVHRKLILSLVLP